MLNARFELTNPMPAAANAVEVSMLDGHLEAAYSRVRLVRAAGRIGVRIGSRPSPIPMHFQSRPVHLNKAARG